MCLSHHFGILDGSGLCGRCTISEAFGKIKICCIFIGHSHDPLPMIEYGMHLISPDNAKLDKYQILPPFTNFGKYAGSKIRTLIAIANTEFVRNGSQIQFKTETLSAAKS